MLINFKLWIHVILGLLTEEGSIVIIFIDVLIATPFILNLRQPGLVKLVIIGPVNDILFLFISNRSFSQLDKKEAELDLAIAVRPNIGTKNNLDDGCFRNI